MTLARLPASEPDAGHVTAMLKTLRGSRNRYSLGESG